MTKVTIHASNDNIFVKRLEAVTKTEAGVIIPDTAQDRPAEGIIVALGPDIVTAERRDRCLQEYLKEHEGADPRDSWAYYDQTFDLGEHVLFGSYSGIEVKIEDEVLVKIKPDEIFCTLVREQVADAEVPAALQDTGDPWQRTPAASDGAVLDADAFADDEPLSGVGR